MALKLVVDKGIGFASRFYKKAVSAKLQQTGTLFGDLKHISVLLSLVHRTTVVEL